MPDQRSILHMQGRAVGVSFISGQGTSGVLCGIQQNNILLIEYQYQDSFALKRYPLREIQNITPFPSCRSIPNAPQPQPPRPRPRLY